METRRDAVEEKSKSLAFRVLLSRRDLGWDQETLADKAGISRGYISKLERGYTKNPGIEIIKSLAKALGVSTEYLLGTTDDPLAGLQSEEDDRPIIKPALHPDPLMEELIRIYQQLNPQQRTTLLNIAKVLRSADEPHIIGSK